MTGVKVGLVFGEVATQEIQDGAVEGFQAGLFLFGLVGDLVNTFGGRGGVVGVAMLFNNLLEIVKMSRKGGVVRNEVGEVGGNIVKADGGSEDVINVVAQALKGSEIRVVLVTLELGTEAGKA